VVGKSRFLESGAPCVRTNPVRTLYGASSLGMTLNYGGVFSPGFHQRTHERACRNACSHTAKLSY
jgi:hypothetical protein